MAVYKVIARCPWRKIQEIKKIYETDLKFEMYGRSWAKGKQFRSNVEVYKMEDDNYKLIYVLKMPSTDEEIEKYVVENKMYHEETKWRIRDLEKTKKYFKDVHNKEIL